MLLKRKVFIDQCSVNISEGQSVPSDVVMVTPSQKLSNTVSRQNYGRSQAGLASMSTPA